MSASLVGSEMCIRDRSASRPARVVLLDRKAELQDSPTAHLPCEWSASPAVSYTHLTLPTICSV
eukprot:5998654-Alexandrium_andersonii.AAC.1